ncbi:hypothetical protein Pcinc_041742 [Petrolisthes cinctipes]|uniref:HTH La-type RNA-binding domain-containing protein n=1 Tax=Petrolisthes cinctipes TaxID=88211 RepID=A0AAE1EI20_PETCI|nr:hypothetical protein Pcinc_041742 [Petrolisthes cinctipes]
MSVSEDSVDGEVGSGSSDSGVGELTNSLADLSFSHQDIPSPPDSPVTSLHPSTDNHRGHDATVDTDEPRDHEVLEQRRRQLSVSSDDSGSGSGSGSGPNGESSDLPRGERVDILRELLETYLSDNYLTRDIFLLKHFRRSREGWISLQFLAAYKRIRRTSGNVKEVVEAAKSSKLLEVNVEGTKVRRTAPLPPCIEDYIPTRTALLADLPTTLHSLAGLADFLTPYGSVVSMQLLRPGMTLPDHLHETVINFPQVRDQWCALVEFDEISAAQLVTEAVSKEGLQQQQQHGWPGWALELVLPWRNGKTLDLTKANSSSSSRQWCLSCPSSGYSSPCLTPEQSPRTASRRTTLPNSLRLTKRERLALDRTHIPTTSCFCHICHHLSHSHLSCTSPGQSRRMYQSGPVSPRRQCHDKLTEANRSINWRAPFP